MMYRGEVIRNDDPLNAGRVKIRIFNFYDGLSEQVIPWAKYADPFMGGSDGVGGIFTPVVGAHVWCFFEGGDHHFPVYFAGAPAMRDGVADIPEGNHPHSRKYRSESGIELEFDDTEGGVRFRIYHPSGTNMVIPDSGDMNEDVVGDKNEVISGDHSISATSITVSASGQVNIEASGPVNITGAVINLN